MTTNLKQISLFGLLALVAAVVLTAGHLFTSTAQAQECATWEYTYTLEGNPFPPNSPGYSAWHALYGESRLVQSMNQVARIDEGGCGGGELTGQISVQLVAVPSSIAPGEQSSLTWSSEFALSCTGTNFSTGGAPNGTVLVSPSATTNYSVTCINSDSNASASATVTVSSNPQPPLACEDATYNIGSWYSGGTQTMLWSETGENASNGGGLNDNGFHMQMCIAECEAGGYSTCNYRFVSDLSEGQASQTTFTCYGVTGSPTLIARPNEISGGPYGNLDTSYTAITIPETCTTGSCICDATYQWNGSSWSLFQNNDPSATCTLPTPPTQSPAAMGAPTWGGQYYNLYIYRDGSNYWDSTDPNTPETMATDSYDQGVCPVTGPDLTMINVVPTSVTAGQVSNFTATVKNNGTALTPNFVSAIFVCAQGDTACTGSVARSGWDKFLAMVFPKAYGAAPVKINLSQTSLAAGAQGPQTGSHTFATAGTYQMRACADNNGNWLGTVTESNENDNCGNWTLLVVNPAPSGSLSCSGVASGMSVTWTASPTNVSPYTWTPTETGTAVSGQTASSYTRTYAAAGSYAMQVRGSDGSVGNCPAVTVGGPGTCTSPTVDITATETRVRTGGSTTLTVTGSGIGTTCTVTNTNTGAVISTLTATSCNVSGTSIATGAINGQTTFTVTCGATTDSVVVNVLPNVTEF